MPDLPPEIEPIVLAVLEARVKEAKAAARAAIEHLYAEGTRTTIRGPLDGTKLGTVYRTDPDPMWKVTDRDALCKALEADPDNVDPADHFRIQPLDVPPCTGCTSPLCPDCEPGTHGGRR
jgi:hypothetical protein